MFQSSGVELSVLNGGNKLFGNRQLRVVTILGEHNVDGIALGGDNLGIERGLRQDNLDGGSLIDSEVRDLSARLDVDGLRVNNLATGDNILEDNTQPLSRVNNNTVDLGGDVDGALLALVHVDGVLGLDLISGDGDVVVALVELNNPLVTLQNGALGGGLLLGGGSELLGGSSLFKKRNERDTKRERERVRERKENKTKHGIQS